MYIPHSSYNWNAFCGVTLSPDWRQQLSVCGNKVTGSYLVQPQKLHVCYFQSKIVIRPVNFTLCLKCINTISKEEEKRKYICPAKARKMHHSNARNIEDFVKHSSPKTKVEGTWLNEAIQHYIHTYIYTFIHTYTHTHIHIHVHTYNDNERKRLGLRNSTPSLLVTKSYLFFLQTSLKIFPPP